MMDGWSPRRMICVVPKGGVTIQSFFLKDAIHFDPTRLHLAALVSSNNNNAQVVVPAQRSSILVRLLKRRVAWREAKELVPCLCVNWVIGLSPYEVFSTLHCVSVARDLERTKAKTDSMGISFLVETARYASSLTHTYRLSTGDFSGGRCFSCRCSTLPSGCMVQQWLKQHRVCCVGVCLHRITFHFVRFPVAVGFQFLSTSTASCLEPAL